jgi:Mn2+/Fe2+ NRAMP family transporter
MVSAAADTDSTTVATLIVVGSTTGYALAWLTVLLLPMLAVGQTLANRVGVLSGRDLQCGRWSTGTAAGGRACLVSVVAVNVATVAAPAAS